MCGKRSPSGLAMHIWVERKGQELLPMRLRLILFRSLSALTVRGTILEIRLEVQVLKHGCLCVVQNCTQSSIRTIRTTLPNRS